MASPTTAPVPATFRMPAQMAVPALCRGALTAWPQLQAALQLLRSTPGLAADFPLAAAAAEPQIGGPLQLAQRLALDPSYLARDTPPLDIHARFVWLVQRVYRAARTVQFTLAELPALVAPAAKRRLADNGALVTAVLSRPEGLIPLARSVAEAADAFAAHLSAVGADVQAACDDYQAAAARVGAAAFQPVDDTHLGAAMQTFGRAAVAVGDARQEAMRCRAAAAKVTAAAVIDNVREAAGAVNVAWSVAAAQFEAVTRCSAADLGAASYLDETLEANTATGEWKTFATVVQEFLGGMLVCRPSALPIAAQPLG